jgi:NADH-quinone oxidoreductase subunit N
MEQTLANMSLFSPELALIGFLVLLFLVDGFIPSTRHNFAPLIIVVLGCVAATVLTYLQPASPSVYFSGLVTNDGLTRFFRYFFWFACAVSSYVAFGSKELSGKGRSEFAMLVLCVTFGMSLMAAANNLLILYLGIETVSIVSFAMAGFNRDDVRSNEASFKYLVFGALASGVMIYGFSLIYGFAGSLQYQEIAKFLAANGTQTPYLLGMALVMVYAGLAYKISSFPMHFWTPDVYEGSPTPVATFFSVGPKAAGFAAIIRIVLEVLSTKTGDGTWKSLEGISLPQSIAVVSALTMVVGNFSAIGQTNVKRILAYSSIAHVGYMLMGLIALESSGCVPWHRLANAPLRGLHGRFPLFLNWYSHVFWFYRKVSHLWSCH